MTVPSPIEALSCRDLGSMFCMLQFPTCWSSGCECKCIGMLLCSHTKAALICVIRARVMCRNGSRTLNFQEELSEQGREPITERRLRPLVTKPNWRSNGGCGNIDDKPHRRTSADRTCPPLTVPNRCRHTHTPDGPAPDLNSGTLRFDSVDLCQLGIVVHASATCTVFCSGREVRHLAGFISQKNRVRFPGSATSASPGTCRSCRKYGRAEFNFNSQAITLRLLTSDPTIWGVSSL